MANNNQRVNNVRGVRGSGVRVAVQCVESE